MQVVMPLEVGIGIGAEDSVRLLLEITERMEMEGLYAAYDRETRAADPSNLRALSNKTTASAASSGAARPTCSPRPCCTRWPST